MLTRDLADRDPSLAQHHVHGIELLKTKLAKNQDTTAGKLETKVRFSPMGLTKLLRPLPGGTDWKFLMVAEDNMYESTHRVECEIPTYLLRKVLPSQMFALPVSAAKSRKPKRTHSSDIEPYAEQLDSATKRARLAQSPTGVTTSGSPSLPRSLAPQPTTAQPAEDVFGLGDIDDNGPLFIRNYPARKPASKKKGSGNVVPRDEFAELEELDLQRALQLSLETQSTASARSAKPTNTPKRSDTPEIIDLT